MEEIPGTLPKVSDPVDVPGVPLNDEAQTPSVRWGVAGAGLSAAGPTSLAGSVLIVEARTAGHTPRGSLPRAGAHDVTATPEGFPLLQGPTVCTGSWTWYSPEQP